MTKIFTNKTFLTVALLAFSSMTSSPTFAGCDSNSDCPDSAKNCTSFGIFGHACLPFHTGPVFNAIVDIVKDDEHVNKDAIEKKEVVDEKAAVVQNVVAQEVNAVTASGDPKEIAAAKAEGEAITAAVVEAKKEAREEIKKEEAVAAQ